MLDISFNRVSEIKNLNNLVNLKKLFLCANKIGHIINLDSLTNLTTLELGDNRIRVSFTIKYLKIGAKPQLPFLEN